MGTRTLQGLIVVACLAVFATAIAAEPPAAPGEGVLFRVRDFGAAGNGKTRDTAAIQKAIQAAAAAGGGTVYLDPGTYLSGTLFLRSGVTLHLREGAVLQGSRDLADFPENKPALRSYTDNYVNRSLLAAEGVHDVAITGRGVIDGQGAAYLGKPWIQRPYLVRIVSSSRVLVEGITLKNSPMWVQHYLDCDYLTIRGITVESHVNHNNDMLDIDGCRNVRVSDCFGDSGDDAITLKSTTARPCENVVITNCVLFSTCNAIKMGTESSGGFKNVTISNCAIGPLRDAKGFFGKRMLAGIALEIVDGGTLERVAISNIVMTGVRVPIFVRLGNRARPYRKGMERPGVGVLRDVTISNVVAEAAERIGCSITGLPGHPVRNVTLSDVRLILPGGGTAEDASRKVPEKAEAYPECTMFGVLPAYGLTCRHVDGLTLRNVQVTCKEADRRPALVCEDARNLYLDGFQAQRVAADSPVIVLRDAADALVRGCRAAEGTGVFLRLAGAVRGVSVLGNDLRRAASAVEFAKDVPADVRKTEIFQASNCR